MRKQKLWSLLAVLTVMICLSVSVAALTGSHPAETSEAATELTFAEMFPDGNFRAYVTGTVLKSSTDAKGDNDKPTAAQMSIIERRASLDISSCSISSLKGISYFSALTELECQANQLTELDISQNTALYYLWCGSNQLTELDVSKNTALIWLSCSNNRLAKLDLSSNSNLYFDYTETSPQSVMNKDARLEASGSGYKLALKQLAPGIDLSRVMMYDGGSLDVSTGIVTYTEKPETVCYLYQTNSPYSDEMVVQWTPVFAEGSILAGDLNGDGTVDSKDLMLLARYLVGAVTLTDDQIAAADLSGDGAVTAADTVLLAKKLLSGN